MTWWQRLLNRDRLERELEAELRDRRNARRTRWVSDIGRDSAFAMRLLVKERWFSGASILALSLGLGVTTMIVTIINGYNFRGLPVDDPERLVYVGTRDVSGREGGLSYPDYLAWRAARSFDSTGAFTGAVMTLGDRDQSPESLGGAYVSREVFEILEETPVLGRRFQAEDDQPGAAAVVILGHRLWTTRYESDAGVIGRPVTVNGTPATIIGVMREGFEFPFRQGLWLPLSLLPGIEAQHRDARVLDVLARLATDAGADQARAELSAIASHLDRDAPGTNVRIEPLVTRFGVQQVGRLGDQQPPLAALATAVFVLLIACANVANLLLARSAGRAREMAIRASVGATRWRIVRQLLVESLLLSLISGALAVWLSRFGVQFMVTAFGRNVPYWMHFPVDGQVIGSVVVLCVFSTLAFGLLPALVASKSDVGDVINEGGRTGIAPRVRRWTQSLLVGEVAVTIVLLAAGGLMVRSFLAVYHADRVIDPSQVLTAEIALPEEKYASAAQRSSFYEQLDDRLGESGLAAAAVASTRPFTAAPRQRVSFREHPAVGVDAQPQVGVVAVGPRYFDTLRVPVFRGRYFDSRDGTPGHEAAVVNQRFVEMFYPDGDPIGRLIRLRSEQRDPTEARWLTIVGVSPTIRQSIASGTRPIVYLPLRSHAGAHASIVVGHLSDVRGIAPQLRRAAAAIDRDVTLFNVRPLRELLDDSRLQPRLIGTIVASFAGIALLLSVVGLYAFTAYGVQQRRHEIGVRVALGARPADVILLFLRRGMSPLAIGLVLGLVGAFAVGQLLRSVLIQTSATDTVTLVSILALIGIVSTCACLLPARQAARLDPLTVLRNE